MRRRTLTKGDALTRKGNGDFWAIDHLILDTVYQSWGAVVRCGNDSEMWTIRELFVAGFKFWNDGSPLLGSLKEEVELVPKLYAGDVVVDPYGGRFLVTFAEPRRCFVQLKDGRRYSVQALRNGSRSQAQE